MPRLQLCGSSRFHFFTDFLRICLYKNLWQKWHDNNCLYDFNSKIITTASLLTDNDSSMHCVVPENITQQIKGLEISGGWYGRGQCVEFYCNFQWGGMVYKKSLLWGRYGWILYGTTLILFLCQLVNLCPNNVFQFVHVVKCKCITFKLPRAISITYKMQRILILDCMESCTSTSGSYVSSNHVSSESYGWSSTSNTHEFCGKSWVVHFSRNQNWLIHWIPVNWMF